jgi:hypothetical protein
MSVWTAADGTEHCGYCRHPFAPDEPIELFAGGRIKRCQECKQSPIDWAAVDQAKHAKEAARLAPVVIAPPVPKSLEDMARIIDIGLRVARNERRQRQKQQPARVPYDGKARASGE